MSKTVNCVKLLILVTVQADEDPDQEQSHLGLHSLLKYIYTLKCLCIGTPKTINFPFVPNGKLIVLGVPIFEHIIIRL